MTRQGGATGRTARRTPSWRPAKSRCAPSKLTMLNNSLTPPFQPTAQGIAGRGSAAEVSLSRPAPAGDAADAAAAASTSSKSMRDYFDEHGFHRRRNADARPQHAGRRPRLPGAQPRAPRHVLRPAAVAAALQANPDGRRLRPLCAGRPLLPRRRPAGRPPAGVHAARPGDVVRRRATT